MSVVLLDPFQDVEKISLLPLILQASAEETDATSLHRYVLAFGNLVRNPFQSYRIRPISWQCYDDAEFMDMARESVLIFITKAVVRVPQHLCS